jgi:hypothetical protein
VPDVTLVACAEVAAAGLGGVVQERLRGEIGEGDTLASQRASDVEAGAALVVQRGVLGLHETHEAIQLRVALGGLEMLVVADEVVAPERHQRWADHPQAAQHHQRMRHLSPCVVAVGEFPHRPVTGVESRGEPALLPGLPGGGGQ